MRSLFLVCIAIAPAGALEVVRRDLSAVVEALPTAFDYRLDTPSGSYSGSDEFDLALGVRIGGRWSFSAPGDRGAWIAGVDLRVGDADYDGVGTYRTVGVGLSAGYGYRLSRDWLVVVEPLLEYGWATLDFDAAADRPGIAADGTHTVWGARAGILYAIAEHWLVQADAGWASIRSDTSSDGRSFELDQQGAVIGVGVSYRISTAPARLE